LETKIDEKQASLIDDIHNAIHKLSSINQSLILLTKLENQEYATNQKINFSVLVENATANFRELIEMKSITLKTEIQQDVTVSLNPVLADILFTNLLSNAIRHNNVNGTIDITLSLSGMTIKNSGAAPKVHTSELFKRFKKGKQNSDSTGLGLAIVKQICELSNFNIQYEYTDGQHVVNIVFSPIK
jgi:signal transduction histidine kinase